VRTALAACGVRQVLLALEDHDACFDVDGPLLVRALALLGEELAGLGGANVLLRARLQRGEPTFSLLWHAPGAQHELLALRRRLLSHEAARLGAIYEEALEDGACARVELRFPAARRGEVQA